MKCEMSHCCQSAALQEPSLPVAAAGVVPWLEGAKPITSSTMARVSGQKRRAQRGTIPPWLWPMIAIFRPARWNMVGIA